MLLVARKNLFSERTRLAIAVGGITLSVFLISLLLSLYRGWDEKVGKFVEDSTVDVWVGAIGVNDFIGAASLVPLEGTEDIDSHIMVKDWAPLIVRPMVGIKVEFPRDPENPGAKLDLHLVGYDTQTGLGGPIKVVEGKEAPGANEIIIDKALSSRYGIDLDDVISAGGREWTVAGISEGGDFVAAQTVFVSLEQAQETLQMEGQATFIVVDLYETVDHERFAAEVATVYPGAVAFTRDEFAANTRELILGNILPILTIVLGLAFVVGLAVSGLTIYTATIEKSREYAIIKAVGFKNAYLYRLVFEQSMVTGALGFAIGIALTLIFGPLAGDWVPQFVTLILWQDVLAVFGATVLMSLVASYVPVRRLAAIDPVAVFRA
jgi:putative ABC transport system permease protein